MPANNLARERTLDSLNDIWNNFQNQIHRPAENHESPLNLYHYTTADGLIGILSSDRIHATDIKLLNDTSELDYALQILDSCEKDLISHFSSALSAKLLEMAFASVQQLKFTFRPFVASFCEDGSLLSQWRAYASNGGGFAIGFNRRNLLRIADPHVELYKIVYDRETQQDVLKSGMRVVCNDLINSFATPDNQADNAIVDIYEPILSRWLVKCLLSFKNPVFQEEKEWRLVYLPTLVSFDFSNIGFATAGGTIRPYTKLRLGTSTDSADHKLPINEIIYGPTHLSQIEDSLVLLISKYCYSTVVIKGSGIPLAR